jgi:hypothetical protein
MPVKSMLPNSLLSSVALVAGYFDTLTNFNAT